MIEYIAIVILALALGLMNWRKNVWKQRCVRQRQAVTEIKKLSDRLREAFDNQYISLPRAVHVRPNTEWPDELSEK
jgi:hypothetical protein